MCFPPPWYLQIFFPTTSWKVIFQCFFGPFFWTRFTKKLIVLLKKQDFTKKNRNMENKQQTLNENGVTVVGTQKNVFFSTQIPPDNFSHNFPKSYFPMYFWPTFFGLILLKKMIILLFKKKQSFYYKKKQESGMKKAAGAR